MARQPIEKRIQRAIKDITEKDADPRARWAKIAEDFPDEAGEIEAKYGPMLEATLDDIDRPKAVYYAGRDADATWRIKPILWDLIQAQGLEGCYRMDLATIPIVNRMQHVGMLVDKQHFYDFEKELTAGMAVKVKELLPWTGDPEFNPNSPDQVAALMFSKPPTGLGLTPKHKTKGGKDSTDDKTLEALRRTHPAIPIIIDFRELGTMRDDFCVKMPRLCGLDGRIHCTIRITRVSSGRLSATTPNMLGIPVRTDLGKKIRAGFPARPGCLLAGLDLDQIEMREIAFQSQDPIMRKAFRDGVDIHRLTGALVFGKDPRDVTTEERYASKRIGFGVITGITEEGLLAQMELAGATGWDLPRCRKVIHDYLYGIYKRIGAYLEECRAEARRNGFVRDRWGRIRYLPGVHSDISWIRYEAERQSHSFKVSASAQGVLKTAMAAMWAYIRPDIGDFDTLGEVEPLLQIHDELLFEGTEEYWDPRECRLDEIRLIMCHSSSLGDIPIKAKGQNAPNWAELKD